MKKLAPVCLFTYNRLEVTRKTIEALKKNFLASESELFIFSDGPKNSSSKEIISEVRKYLKTISGFKKIEIYESLKNKGLANSIIDGVTKIIEKYGKVIVLEDDLVTSPNFLDFMNQALEFYIKANKIKSINGFSLKLSSKDINQFVYFHQRTFPWGWATWKDRWDKRIFDKTLINEKISSDKSILTEFNRKCGSDISTMLLASLKGKNNSWYVRWVFNHFTNNSYAVFPILSKVKNVGFNNEGTHCNEINVYQSNFDLLVKREFIFNNFYELNSKSNTEFLRFFKKKYKLKYRIGLLKYSYGRNQIKNEILQRIIKKYSLFISK